MQTAQPRHQLVRSPGFSRCHYPHFRESQSTIRPPYASKPRQGLPVYSPSQPAVSSFCFQRRGRKKKSMCNEPILERSRLMQTRHNRAAENKKINFEGMLSFHRQPLTGFNKPASPGLCTPLHSFARLPSTHSVPSPPFVRRGKSRLVAVNRAKKIPFAFSVTQILQLREDFPLRGYSVLPLPEGEGRGEGEETLRTQTG